MARIHAIRSDDPDDRLRRDSFQRMEPARGIVGERGLATVAGVMVSRETTYPLEEPGRHSFRNQPVGQVVAVTGRAGRAAINRLIP